QPGSPVLAGIYAQQLTSYPYPDPLGTTYTSSPYAGAFDGQTNWSTFQRAPLLDNTQTLMLDPVILGGRNRGTAVSTILASGGGNPIIDVGASAQPGIAIIGTDEKLGTWYFSRDNGVHWTRLKGASVTRAWLLDAGPGTRIRFVPRPGLHRGSI